MRTTLALIFAITFVVVGARVVVAEDGHFISQITSHDTVDDLDMLVMDDDAMIEFGLKLDAGDGVSFVLSDKSTLTIRDGSLIFSDNSKFSAKSSTITTASGSTITLKKDGIHVQLNAADTKVAMESPLGERAKKKQEVAPAKVTK